MQLRSLVLFASVVVGTFVSAATPPKYYCTTDADCEKNGFPNTVCIGVDMYGEVTKKCTPNTKTRPACKGAQPGLCPSYQSPESAGGYLNAHCVFVAKDSSSAASSAVASGSGSSSGPASVSPAKNATKTTRRWLLIAATNKTADGSKSGSTVADITVPSTDGSDATAPAVVKGETVTVKINNQTVTGEFKCVDLSDCENQAFDPSNCQPATCGSPNSKEQCNTHGTCSYKSTQTMNKRSCLCYAGYDGDKCQREVSGECDVDCGYGGDCVDGECKCKKGYDGKAYNGKSGKPNERCTKCTNDLACQNGNTCDTAAGSCTCSPGFSGPTCGATEDGCTKMTCGIGSCQPFANGTGACYCPICQGDCQLCPTKDCSTCPSPASTIVMSKMTIFVAFLALVVINAVF